MKLFDFLKIFFGNNPAYNDLKTYDKAKQRFMVNRFFAIKFPTTAHLLNINGTAPEHVVESWHMVAAQFQRPPGWIYTKVRNTKPKDEKRFEPSEETLKFYLRKHRLSMNDYKECLKINAVELLDELEKIESEINGNSN